MFYERGEKAEAKGEESVEKGKERKRKEMGV
jgi:hypothetical protein